MHLPAYTLIAFITAPIATKIIFVSDREYGDTERLSSANLGMIQLHLFFGILLSAGLVV